MGLVFWFSECLVCHSEWRSEHFDLRSVVEFGVAKSRARDRADCSMVLRYLGMLQANSGNGRLKLSEAYQLHWVLPLETYRCRREEYIQFACREISDRIQSGR